MPISTLPSLLLGKGQEAAAVSAFKEKLELAQMEIVEDPSKDYFFHAWVYIAISDCSGFFIEATTGEKHPLSHAAYKRFSSSTPFFQKQFPMEFLLLNWKFILNFD